MSDKPEDDPDDIAISPHLIFLTGNIVTWWGRTEYLLTSDLRKLLSNPALEGIKEFEVLQIASKRRIKQWHRAHKIVHSDRPDILKEVGEIADELRDVLEDRNILMHGMWHVFGHECPHKIKVTHLEPPDKDGNIMMRTYDITEGEVDEICKRSYNLYHRLVQLSMNLSFSFGGVIRWSIRGKD